MFQAPTCPVMTIPLMGTNQYIVRKIILNVNFFISIELYQVPQTPSFSLCLNSIIYTQVALLCIFCMY
uniref:Uncharacterized protein n=1 Tax=Rhizophora mucronata TaxID=61149 RepID=A0A2P2QQZ2_RHIMU